MIFPRNSKGAVLFVALVFLVLLTLLGLTAASTSILQERMTGGMRNSQLSLMGADTVARAAEARLWNLADLGDKLNCGYWGGPTRDCFAAQSYPADAPATSGTILKMNPEVQKFRTSGSASIGTEYVPSMTSGLGTATLAEQPEYILEYKGVLLAPGANANGEGGSATRYATANKSTGSQTMYSYRITARSTGGSDASIHAVETYFGTGVPSN
ncbi:MAG TPA: PilX N-terminal domain-containing pilus assembly protein [Rudaea sp.]|nr:PilX N-terminal domain-containing pilus assembly protein [Rudaea sp.]